MFCINPLSDVSFAKFFLSFWFPHSPDIIFHRAEVINFNEVQYQLILSRSVSLGLYLKSLLYPR